MPNRTERVYVITTLPERRTTEPPAARRDQPAQSARDGEGITLDLDSV